MKLIRMLPLSLPLIFWLGATSTSPSAGQEQAEESAPIEIVDPADEVQPEFEKDILPFLQRSCLACHNASTAEADVVLESPQTMLAYEGDGPLVVPGDVEAGKLLAVAAHQQEPFMPPSYSDVEAPPLTPAELGLLKRWIELGAKSAQRPTAESPVVRWQPLSADYGPILAAEISAHGDLSVCARGNRIEVYDLVHGEPVATLVDPALESHSTGFAGAAHLDLVRSLAMTADGEWIASGGFRNVKLWRRLRTPQSLQLPAGGIPQALALAPTWIAVGDAEGLITISPIDQSTAAVSPISLEGHETQIVGLATTSDASELISVSAEGQVRCWHAPSGKLLATWQLSTPPRHVALVNDELLVTASEDLTLRLWNLDRQLVATANTGDDPGDDESTQDNQATKPVTLKPLREYRGHGRDITALATIGGDARAFLSGSIDGTVRRWDSQLDAATGTWIHGHAVHAISVTPDSSQFVSVGGDGTAKLWATGNSEPVLEWRINFPSARQLAHLQRSEEIAASNLSIAEHALENSRQQLASDEQAYEEAQQQLAVGKKALAEKEAAEDLLQSRLGEATATAKKLAELKSLAQQTSDSFRQHGPTTHDELAPIDTLLASLRQLAPAEGKKAPSAEPAAKTETSSVVQAADNVAGTLDQLRRMTDQLGGQLASLLGSLEKQSEQTAARIETLSAENDEATKAVEAARTARDEGETALRRALEGVKASRQVVTRAAGKHENAEQDHARQRQELAVYRQSMVSLAPVRTADFSSDGKQLLFSDERGGNYLFDAKGGTPLATWQTTAGDTPSFAHFYGSQRMVTLAKRSERVANLWDTRSQWQLARTIGAPEDPSNPLVDRVLALDFSPTGQLLAIGGGEPSRSGQVLIWDLESNCPHSELDESHADSVMAVAFSRDGEFLATSSADRSMKVFRMADGKCVQTFEGHTHHVLDVAWRANGQQLATASADKTIKVWDRETGEQVRTISSHGKEVTGVDFLGIGGQLVTTSGDHTIRIHNVEDGKQVRVFSQPSDYVYSCAATTLGDLVVAGSADQTLRVFDITAGNQRYAFAAEEAN